MECSNKQLAGQPLRSLASLGSAENHRNGADLDERRHKRRITERGNMYVYTHGWFVSGRLCGVVLETHSADVKTCSCSEFITGLITQWNLLMIQYKVITGPVSTLWMINNSSYPVLASRCLKRGIMWWISSSLSSIWKVSNFSIVIYAWTLCCWRPLIRTQLNYLLVNQIELIWCPTLNYHGCRALQVHHERGNWRVTGWSTEPPTLRCWECESVEIMQRRQRGGCFFIH